MEEKKWKLIDSIDDEDVGVLYLLGASRDNGTIHRRVMKGFNFLIPF